MQPPPNAKPHAPLRSGCRVRAAARAADSSAALPAACRMHATPPHLGDPGAALTAPQNRLGLSTRPSYSNKCMVTPKVRPRGAGTPLGWRNGRFHAPAHMQHGSRHCPPTQVTSSLANSDAAAWGAPTQQSAVRPPTTSHLCPFHPRQISGLVNGDVLAALNARGMVCATGDNTWTHLKNLTSPHSMLYSTRVGGVWPPC